MESDDTTAYYVWNSEESFRAFPNGFRMIGGMRPTIDPTRADASCGGAAPCNKPRNNCNSPNTFFPTTQCEELEVEMAFPNCWDGVNLDPDDHMSHVVYSNDGTEFGDCPLSHPVKLPVIELFFRINNYKGGHYTFADDSSVYHADYISGWDQDFWQLVLDTCTESTFDTPSQDSCRGILNYRTPSFASYGAVENPFALMLQDLAALQPPPLDTQGTIAPEAITGIAVPPRGTCSGTLLPFPNALPTTTTPATTVTSTTPAATSTT